MGSNTEVLQLSPEEDEEARLYAVQLVMAAALPMTLKAAIELRLLEIIVKAGPGAKLSAVDVASQLPTQNPQAADMVDRMLRLLAAYRIVSCTAEPGAAGQLLRKYGATPVCKHLTVNEDGVSMAPLCLFGLDKVMINFWYYLKDAVLEGGVCFHKAYGMTAFEYNGTDPRFNKLFNECMRSHSSIITEKLLDVYCGFDDVKVLVDVGGGTGAALHMITSRHLQIKGINFDLPHVISEAPSFPGVEHVSGDMFVSVPQSDTIFMKWILHDWNDEQCSKLLKNCWKALPEKGKLIVVEYVLPLLPEPNLNIRGAFHLDINMMVFLGGKERTLNEFQALALEAGFSGFTSTYISMHTWVIEFKK